MRLKLKKARKAAGSNMLLVITVAMFIFCCIFNSAFLSRMNISGLLVEISYMSFLAIGMTFVILTGGIDLSVGAIAGLSTVIIAYTMKNSPWKSDGTTIVMAIILAVGVAALLGLLNGLMVAYFNLPPLIVTLAVTWIASGFGNRMMQWHRII